MKGREQFLQNEVNRLLRLILCLQNRSCSDTAGSPDCLIPIIAIEPTSQELFAGSNVTLQVIATGDDLTYQWKKDGNNITDATESTLILEDVSNADIGAYTVVVSNSCGSASGTADIIVIPAVPDIVVYWAWMDTDPYDDLQIADDIFYQGQATITHNQDIPADFRPGSGSGNIYVVVKIPQTESIKLDWSNTPLNYGPIPDQVWRDPFLTDYNEFRYYVSRTDIGLDPNFVTTLTD